MEKTAAERLPLTSSRSAVAPAMSLVTTEVVMLLRRSIAAMLTHESAVLRASSSSLSRGRRRSAGAAPPCPCYLSHVAYIIPQYDTVVSGTVIHNYVALAVGPGPRAGGQGKTDRVALCFKI